jgi:hypothetical protein
MRIELDRPIAPDCTLWDQYALHYNSTGPAVAKRYYFNGRTWTNDADHIRMVGLELPQAQIAASITALSGGTMISGDQLYDLDAARIDILKKVFPSSGKAARPIDLFETTQPALFVTPFSTSAGEWNVVGVFNWSDTTVTRTLSAERLCLHPGAAWLAFDFWNQTLIAHGTTDLVLQQPPRSCNVLAIRERTGTPQLVGTSRHITQGAIELKDVSWNNKTNTLSGTALGVPGMQYDLFIHVPTNYQPEPSAYAQLIPAQPELVKLHITFAQGPTANWQLTFKAAAAHRAD